MVLIIAGFHSFHPDVSQIKTLVLSTCKRLILCDDPAVLIPALHQIEPVMVIMPVGDKDQVCRQVIRVSGIGIDIDHFAFSRDDPQTSLPHIQEGGGSGSFRGLLRRLCRDCCRCGFRRVCVFFWISCICMCVGICLGVCVCLYICICLRF